MADFKLTILCDNQSSRPDLAAENGLSVLIERDGNAMLFDAGPSRATLDNAAALGIDLGRVSVIALSHNHYDHTRGLLSFDAQFSQAYTTYISRHFFKTSVWDRTAETGWMTPTSGPVDAAYLRAQGQETRLAGSDILAIEGFEGAWLLSNLSPCIPFETVEPTNLILRDDDWVVDDYRDEMALVLECGDGLAVVTGCAHAGICSIVTIAEQRFGRPVRALIGGTHLVAADETRIAQAVDFLCEKKIPLIRPCHCTGEAGRAAFEDVGVSIGKAGDRFEL